MPTITSGTLASGDTAAFTETFDTKNVGIGKTLTAAGSVNDGNGGSNYALTFLVSTAGAIAQRAITVTAAAYSKVYDGATTAAAAPTVTSGSLATGDTAAFSESYVNKNVGTSLTLTPAGSVSDGDNGSDYAVTFVVNGTGQITARAITVTAQLDVKSYDGKTTAYFPTPTAPIYPVITSGSLASGDAAAFTESFGSENYDLSDPLTPAGSVNDGNNGANYTVSFASTTGLIRSERSPSRPPPTARSTTARPAPRACLPSPAAAWWPAKWAPGPRPTTTGTRAPARRSPRPVRSPTATAAATTASTSSPLPPARSARGRSISRRSPGPRPTTALCRRRGAARCQLRRDIQPRHDHAPQHVRVLHRLDREHGQDARPDRLRQRRQRRQQLLGDLGQQYHRRDHGVDDGQQVRGRHHPDDLHHGRQQLHHRRDGRGRQRRHRDQLQRHRPARQRRFGAGRAREPRLDQWL